MAAVIGHHADQFEGISVSNPLSPKNRGRLEWHFEQYVRFSYLNKITPHELQIQTTLTRRSPNSQTLSSHPDAFQMIAFLVVMAFDVHGVEFIQDLGDLDQRDVAGRSDPA
jgi:hypothetical protein